MADNETTGGFFNKKLGPLPVWAWTAIGGTVAGVGYFLYRRYQSSKSASSSSTSSTSSTTSNTGTTTSQYNELESQIAGLYGLNSNAYGGYYTTSGTSGTSSTGTSTTSTTSTSTSSSPSSTTSTGSTATVAPSISGGHANNVTNNTAVVAWTGHGASSYKVTIIGPGKINGFTNIVPVPQATYSGLEAGHNYEVTVTPYSGANGTGTPGVSGVIHFLTTK